MKRSMSRRECAAGPTEPAMRETEVLPTPPPRGRRFEDGLKPHNPLLREDLARVF
jgi:hypothetical protein